MLNSINVNSSSCQVATSAYASFSVTVLHASNTKYCLKLGVSEHRHREASAIQICLWRATLIHSRFFSLLLSLFPSFFSKILCAYAPSCGLKVSILRQHNDVLFSLHSKHASKQFPSSFRNLILDLVDSWPLGDPRSCYHLFPTNSKDFS